jgi:hypothetical protein
MSPFVIKGPLLQIKPIDERCYAGGSQDNCHDRTIPSQKTVASCSPCAQRKTTGVQTRIQFPPHEYR